MRGGRRASIHRRELNHELRARTLAVAESADPAAMKFDQMFGDGEAEAEARRFTRRRRVLLAESLEDVRQELPVDSMSVVLDDDGDVASLLADPNLNASA